MCVRGDGDINCFVCLSSDDTKLLYNKQTFYFYFLSVCASLFVSINNKQIYISFDTNFETLWPLLFLLLAMFVINSNHLHVGTHINSLILLLFQLDFRQLEKFLPQKCLLLFFSFGFVLKVCSFWIFCLSVCCQAKHCASLLVFPK